MTSHGNTSQEEIWDDSVLVDSWNDALQEYKQYHSIQARGEKVEDVLKACKKKTNGYGGKMDYEEGQVDEESDHDLPAKTSLPEETVDHDRNTPGNDSHVKNKPFGPGLPSESGPQKGPALPQHLIGQVHDESLKNLLMSWYYAGYYTGLYEGQRQGTQGTDAKHEN